MRHLHPRGNPIGGGSPGYYGGGDWCPACVSQGITTFDELTKDLSPRRGSVKVGMTVTWIEEIRRASLGGRLSRERITGQVWSLAENPQGSWYKRYDGTFWWVVDKDGRAYKVNQDLLTVLSKEQADVCLV